MLTRCAVFLFSFSIFSRFSLIRNNHFIPNLPPSILENNSEYKRLLKQQKTEAEKLAKAHKKVRFRVNLVVSLRDYFPLVCVCVFSGFKRTDALKGFLLLACDAF